MSTDVPLLQELKLWTFNLVPELQSTGARTALCVKGKRLPADVSWRFGEDAQTMSGSTKVMHVLQGSCSVAKLGMVQDAFPK